MTDEKMKLNKLQFVLITIFAIAILIAVVLLFLTSMKDDVFTVNDNSSSEMVLADNGTATTLDDTPDTHSAVRKNRTWLEFDGIAAAVDYDWASTGNLRGSSHTVSMWVNASGNLIDDENWFIRDFCVSNMHFFNSTLLTVKIEGATDRELNYTIPGQEFNDSLWHHYGYTWNNNTANLTIYYDGVAVASNDSGVGEGQASCSSAEYIGYTSKSINGSIDEVRIYLSQRKSDGNSSAFELGGIK